MDSGPPQKGSRRALTCNHPNHPHPTCWGLPCQSCEAGFLARHDCFSCTAVPVFQAGGLGLTSRTTSRARTVRLILSNPELSSFDLKPPTRSYGKRSRPDRHQVATTRVRLHALVVLASSHEPVTNIYLTSGRISRYLPTEGHAEQKIGQVSANRKIACDGAESWQSSPSKVRRESLRCVSLE